MIELREFRVGDEPYLRLVLESAIHDVAIRDYSQAEVDAWAPRQFDSSLWARRVRGIAPYVVERNGEIVAYADVQPNGYIDHFFVAATPMDSASVGDSWSESTSESVNLGSPSSRRR